METAGKLPGGTRRVRGVAAGGIFLLMLSFVMSAVLHRAALGWVEVAKRHMGQGEWLPALKCLDRALREDPFLVDAYLLRATANNAYVPDSSAPPGIARAYSPELALSDADWYLRYRPESADGHFQRAKALSILRRYAQAREELAVAIPLSNDPTASIVERAGISLEMGHPEAAVAEISEAIKVHPLDPAFYEARASYRRLVFDERGADEDRTRAAILRESRGISLDELEARVAGGIETRPISAAQDDPDIRVARDRLMGKWHVVAFRNHTGRVDLSRRDFAITFKPNAYVLVLDGKTIQDARFWLDPGREPRCIDWIADVRGHERRLLGIYEFRGEDLWITMGNEGQSRPTEMTPAGFKLVEAYVLRRADRR